MGGFELWWLHDPGRQQAVAPPYQHSMPADACVRLHCTSSRCRRPRCRGACLETRCELRAPSVRRRDRSGAATQPSPTLEHGVRLLAPALQQPQLHGRNKGEVACRPLAEQPSASPLNGQRSTQPGDAVLPPPESLPTMLRCNLSRRCPACCSLHACFVTRLFHRYPRPNTKNTLLLELWGARSI